MKRLTLLFVLLASLAGACAQTIHLKNGEAMPADGLLRNGDMIMVQVKTANGQPGQVGYHVSDVAAIDQPEPEAVSSASKQIATGQFQAALAQIEPVVTFQKTIRDIPGNCWAKAALVQVEALSGLNRADDATVLVNEISSNSKDPEILNAAKLQIILSTKYNDPQQALTAYDAIINQASDPATLSRAWIAEGDIHFAQHQFDEALMAYLTVAVFYPGKNALLPKALWGSGQAYDKLKDSIRSTKAYETLIANFPDSPEASLAQAELKKKDKKS